MAGAPDIKLEASVTITAREADGSIPEVPLLDELLTRGVIDAAEKHRITLAFQEAFTNSLEHGILQLLSAWKDEFDNEGRDLYALRRKERLEMPEYANCSLVVQSEYEGGRFTICIRDEGEGFSLNYACDAIRKRTPASFHGRGLNIIGSIMDEVFFNDTGTEITMVKYLGQ